MPGNPGRNLDGSDVNRYADLIDEIPNGQFYQATGIRIPYQGTRPYDLVMQTSQPNRVFGIFTNDRFRGTVTTDTDSVARFSLTLDLGKNTIVLEDDITAERIQTTVDARHVHTALAALAEVLEVIDANITDSFNDLRLETAERGQIEDVWGKRLLHLNTPAYQHEAYREQLQEVHQAYRMFGGRRKGLDNTVSSITTATPLAFPFRTFGPRWVLGDSFVRNARFQERDRSQFTRASAIPGVTPTGFGPANQLGAGTLTFTFVGTTLAWTTPGGAIGPAVNVGAGGAFELNGPALPARLDGRTNGTFAIVAATNDKLRLNLDGKGSITITLTAGGARTGAQVAADINAALTADTRYGATYGAVASVLTTDRVRLQTPASTAGATASIVLENIAADAYFTVLGYPWVRSTLVNPEAIGSTSLELVSSDDFRSADASNTFQVVVARNTVREELVTISANNRTTDILTVPAPGLVIGKLAGDVVEQYSSFPYQLGSANEEQGASITVVAGSLPGINDTETVTLLGSNVPDGWLADNVASADANLLEYGWFDFQQLALANDGTGDTTLETDADDRVFQYLEWPFTFSVWVRNRHTAPISVRVGVNFGVGWVESGAVAVPSVNANGGDEMTYISLATVLPATATQFKVRVRHDGAGAGQTIELARAVLRQPNVTALNLGVNTTPRSEHRAYFGELIFIWSPIALAATEDQLIGLPFDPATPKGHVDTVLPAHVEGDRFDVTEYTVGVAKNLKGAFTEADLFGGIRTNLDLVVRTPARRSYLRAARISLVSGELLTFPTPPVAPFVATLAITSNQDQTATRMYEDGTLMPNTRWQFDSATVVRVLTGYNSGAVYTIDYQALIRFESASIDLAGTFADYIFYVDIHAWSRYESLLVTVARTSQVVFNPQTRRARLGDRSDQDKTTSSLIENDGLNVRTVPSVGYRYLDNQTVLIAPDQFNTDAIYFLTYQSLRANPTKVPTITIERRRAATLIALAAAPYAATEKDAVLPATGRFLQYRVSISGIVDVRDFRLSSVSAKGLNAFGVGGTIPILRP